jgi:hypothetical protein
VMSGYFMGGNVSNDTICLIYGGVERCARLSGNAAAQSIADNLRTLQPDKNSYLSQKASIKKLVNAGAVNVSANAEDAVVGPFEASKISYVVDYRGLTVEKLGAAGISPNDETIYSVTQVTYWMDKKTGLMVKSHAAIDNKGTKSYFDVLYNGIEVGDAAVPFPPSQTYDVTEFLRFYKASAQEYTSKEECNSKQGTERDACYKSLAIEKKSWDICKQIADALEYERCTMYIAQATNNYVLCEQLPTLGDDCYISVVSQTGNVDVCKKLKNTSLTTACADAVAEGKRLQDARDEALMQRVLGQNCAENSGCKTSGTYQQYCIPKNTTLNSGIDDSPSIVYGCYANLTCGCYANYCGFNKTDEYYKCVSGLEDDLLQTFINKLVDSKNQTNGTNTSK